MHHVKRFCTGFVLIGGIILSPACFENPDYCASMKIETNREFQAAVEACQIDDSSQDCRAAQGILMADEYLAEKNGCPSYQ